MTLLDFIFGGLLYGCLFGLTSAFVENITPIHLIVLLVLDIAIMIKTKEYVEESYYAE